MNIHSKIFGEFSVDEQNVIHFAQGIPGLEKVTHYAMVSIEEYEPIIWMISTDGVYHFPLVNVNTVDFSDYDVDSKNVYWPLLQKVLTQKSDFVAYIILKLDQSVQQVSLRAPILIHPKNRTGLQLVFDNVLVD